MNANIFFFRFLEFLFDNKLKKRKKYIINKNLDSFFFVVIHLKVRKIKRIHAIPFSMSNLSSSTQLF
jgi:hypothetical protein